MLLLQINYFLNYTLIFIQENKGGLQYWILSIITNNYLAQNFNFAKLERNRLFFERFKIS